MVILLPFFYLTILLLIGCSLGDLKVIHGQGMPSQRHHELGDMYVKLNVEFPDHIDPGVIPFLEQALPPRKPTQMFEKNIEIDEVSLDDAGETRSRRATAGDEMDEDEDGQPRVQCAQQ
jgi:DnaJ family protein A protein 2